MPDPKEKSNWGMADPKDITIEDIEEGEEEADRLDAEKEANAQQDQ